MMLATVTYCHNPFYPALNREVKNIRRRRRIDKLAPRTTQPYICLLNGQPLLRKHKGWHKSVSDGDVVAFILLPQGGGGGGSSPLKIILAISIAIIAPQIGFSLASSMGSTLGAFAGTFEMGQFFGSIISFGLKMLVNALIPEPSASSAQRTQRAMAAPSPTYTLAAQGNQARAGQVIPVLYGRHIVYPDYGAQPYAEYAGNEQYLYQLFVISQGELDIEQLRLEDSVIENSVVQDGARHTAAGSFEEVEYQVCFNQPVTLYPTNVATSVEVTGQEMDSKAATYSQTLTTLTVTLTAHGYTPGTDVYLNFTSGTATDGFYTVATAATNTFTVTAASATTSGAVSVGNAIGPFAASAAGEVSNAIAIDVVFPKGLYFANVDGGLETRTVEVIMEVRPIDDNGAPTGAWALLGDEITNAATITPQRKSFRYTVAAARYEVRMARFGTKDTNIRTGNDVLWGGLRSYLPGSQNYGAVTVLALKMRASNQLSVASSRRVNVIATRKLPIWNGASWSAVTATRNPAWAFADICRASYGMGLADARINLAELLALAAVWSARGDNLDGVFDSASTTWEALTLAARSGRAIPFLQGGIVNIARDAPATTPVAMFSLRNIVKNSLKINYLMPNEETADAVDVEYFDAGVWQPKQVRAALPGSAESVVASTQFFGVTGRDQAWREGMYSAAANRYRRRLVTFTTEMEGFIPSISDLIAIQHDMPQWGVGGDIIDWVLATKTATLSEPVAFAESGTHYVALRKRDGSVAGPFGVTAGAASNQVVFTLDPTGACPMDTGADRERTHFAFGLADAMYIEARVLAVKPRGMETVVISAVIESEFVHTADTGTAPTAAAWQLPTKLTVPVIAGLFARSDPDTANKMFISWQPAPNADHYIIELSDSGNGWTRVGETSAAHYTTDVPFGSRTQVRVAAVGAVRGPWVEINYGQSASYMWSGTDSNLMWNVDSATLMWSY